MKWDWEKEFEPNIELECKIEIETVKCRGDGDRICDKRCFDNAQSADQGANIRRAFFPFLCHHSSGPVTRESFARQLIVTLLVRHI
jgi:hypothetical protein